MMNIRQINHAFTGCYFQQWRLRNLYLFAKGPPQFLAIPGGLPRRAGKQDLNAGIVRHNHRCYLRVHLHARKCTHV